MKNKFSNNYNIQFLNCVKRYLRKKKMLPSQLPKKEILFNLFSELYHGKKVPDETNFKEWIYNDANRNFLNATLGWEPSQQKIKVPRVKKIPKEKIDAQTTWEYKVEYYHKYLKSAAWRKIARLVLERDNFKCCRCPSINILQVHHKTYAHIYFEKEHLDDLETLCSICHKKETIRLGQNKTLRKL